MTIIHIGHPIATAVQVAVSTVASTGSITRFSPEDHMHQGINSAGMSNVGNTSGTTGVGPGRLVFAGGNNITLSQGTDATGSTLTISAAAGGGAGYTAGMSNVGNTSGTTGVADRRLLIVGGNNITISQSLDAANSSGTLTISAFAQTGPTLTHLGNFGPADVGIGTNHATVFFAPMFNVNGIVQGIPGNITANTINFQFSGSHTNTSASTDGQTYTFDIAVYTISGTSTANMLYLASTTFGGAAASDMSSKYHGFRVLSFHSSQFSNSASNATTPSFTHGGEYYMAWRIMSSGTNFPLSIRGVAAVGTMVQASGTIGTSVVTGASLGNYHPWYGGLSTYTTGFPATIHRSNLICTTFVRIPVFMIVNDMSAY